MYRLNSRIAVGIMISPLLILGFQKQVEAATYQLNNVNFADNAILTGTFNYDGTNYSAIDLTYTAGSNADFPSTTYISDSSTVTLIAENDQSLDLENTSDQQYLNLIFADPLVNSSDNLVNTDNILVTSEASEIIPSNNVNLVIQGGSVSIVNAATSSVPEPLSIMGTITAAMYGVVLRGRKGMSQKREKTQL